jgi:selenocysteine-specific elongation factor
MKSIIIGTAGHIDHGKTALVKALPGIDADRLEEEEKRRDTY